MGLQAVGTSALPARKARVTYGFPSIQKISSAACEICILRT